MVGEPKYPPEQIYWILDNVLKKTKNDVMSQGFLETFGKTLSPTQIRYVKNKYGKDPDFNAPLINKRLEYRGPLPLGFPYGSSATASSSSQARPGFSRSAQVVPTPTQLSPSHPASMPIPSIEQPFTPPSGNINYQYWPGFFSPPRLTDYAAGGAVYPSPGQVNYMSPLELYSPSASGALPPFRGLDQPPELIQPRLDQCILPQTVSNSQSGINTTASSKRPLDREEEIHPASPAPKRSRPEASAMARPDMIARPRHGSQSTQTGQHGQDITLSTPYQSFSDQFQVPSAMPTVQNPSTYTMSLYNSNESLQANDVYSFWNQPSFAGSPPTTVDPMLQNMTPVRPTFEEASVVNQHQLPMLTDPIPAHLLPQMIPLPDDDMPPTAPQPSQPLMLSSQNHTFSHEPLFSSPQALQQSVAPWHLLNTEPEAENYLAQSPARQSVKQQQQQATSDSKPTLASVQQPHKEISPGPSQGNRETLIATFQDTSARGQTVNFSTETMGEDAVESERVELFAVEDFLLDLEPLVWAAHTDNPKNEET